MYKDVLSAYISAHNVHVVLMGARRGCYIPCSQSYKWLKTIMRMLGIESKSFEIASTDF